MYFKVVKKSTIIIAASIILAISIVLFSDFGRSVLTSSTTRDLPIYNVQKDEKVISLSFDAAWGNEDTQQLIDILGKEDIKATFFVVGEWVDKYPESVKALHEAGHEIQNHSNTHPHMPQLSVEQIIAETNACNDKIEAITSVRPTLLRPPFGDYDDKLVSTLRSIGMYTIQWDVDSLDWKNPSPSEIISRVVKKAQPGSLVLFHNAAKNTPAALPGVIAGLKAEGYSFIPISDMIYRENYTIDHTGKQIPNNQPQA